MVNLSDCRSALVIDKTKITNRRHTKLMILKTITKEKFDQIKNSLDIGGKFEIFEIPIESTTNWDEFREKRDAFMQNFRIEFDEQNTDEYESSYLSPVGASTFLECVREVTNRSGLSLFIIDGNPSDHLITLRLRFNAQDTSVGRAYSINAQNAKFTKKDDEDWFFDPPLGIGFLDRKWAGSQDKTFIFERNPDEETRISVSVDPATSNASDEVRLLRRPRIWEKRVVRQKQVVKSNSVGGEGGYRRLTITLTTPNDDSRWEFLEQPKIERDEMGTFDSSPRVEAAALTPKEFYYQQGASCSPGRSCAHSATVKAIASIRELVDITAEGDGPPPKAQIVTVEPPDPA